MPVVRATETFRKRAARLLTDAECVALAEFLAVHPESGDVVAGTGGVRKLRWGMAGQGKRGGARVLHLYLMHRDTLWLLDIYGKREKADMSPADVKAVRALVNAIKRAAG